MKQAIPVSIQAVYDKLRGVEPAVAAELVPVYRAEGQAIIAAIEAAAPALPAGGGGGGADRGRPSAPEAGWPADGECGVPGAILPHFGPRPFGLPWQPGRGAASGPAG